MKLYISKMWGWDDVWQQDNFEKSFSEYNTSILQKSGKHIGYIQLKTGSEATYLSMLVLEPKFQSKGLGPVVLDKIQQNNHGKPINLRCFKVNQSALSFYLREGFEVKESDEYFTSMCRN